MLGKKSYILGKQMPTCGHKSTTSMEGRIWAQGRCVKAAPFLGSSLLDGKTPISSGCTSSAERVNLAIITADVTVKPIEDVFAIPPLRNRKTRSLIVMIKA